MIESTVAKPGARFLATRLRGWAKAVVVIGVPSFIAGGFLWEPLRFRMPRYCVVDYRVVDGDTLECEWRKIRLEGYDTPEPKRPNEKCTQEEKKLGAIATCVLENLLHKSQYAVVPTYKRDEHGRHVAALRIDGFDAGRQLLVRDVARLSDGKGEKPDWCAIIAADPSLLEIKCQAPR